MENRFFSYLQKYSVLGVKYAFFLFNLSLLVGLGVKTVNLWISDPFDFSDTLAAFPDEPEWIDRSSAENQFWIALSVETILFVIGGFLCYEMLIKQKTFRRSLTAPIAIAFLFAAGESIPLFLPAVEKVNQIKACKAMDISWDAQNHHCRLMDLELKRFEQLKLHKKTAPAPIVKPAAEENAAPAIPPVKASFEKKAKKTESLPAQTQTAQEKNKSVPVKAKRKKTPRPLSE